MKKILVTLAVVVLGLSCTERIPVYLDESRPVEERVEDALSRMTLEEKVAVIHAQSKFSSAGVPRLGIPELWCTDGPHGIRAEVKWDEWDQAEWTSDSCTAYPALTALASTWDTELSYLYGVCIGEEARYRGKDVLLGPGVNIYRTPLNGRNFEYMGEDPYLAGKMAVPYVKGVQTNGVAACVKHYALNNQEVRRHTTHVIVDDRTLHEIYLPAFKMAVQEGGAWSVMGSYNLYNGEWGCHNEKLINDILKGEWEFDGALISDWGGVHIVDDAIKNGLDLEFGSWTDGLTMGKSNAYDSYYLASPYLERLRSGEVGTDELDEKVRRVLRLMYRTSMNPEHQLGKFTCPEHSAAARKIGAESIVLLKNEGDILPLKDAGKVLVVGENAIKMMSVGGGSSSLKAKYEVSPLEGLRDALEGVELVYERGYVGDVSGSYNGVTAKQDLSEERSAEKLIEDAVAAAKDADYVIFIGGLNKSKGQDRESSDRNSYALPYNQDAVIEALAAVTDRLVVVNISGNAVAMPWIDRVPAVVQGWYLGSEAGNSLADVLTGKVNPSGKLPFTFPVLMEDGPLKTDAQYPGVKRAEKNDFKVGSEEYIWDEEYSEGVYVGYRWYEAESVKPLFPFGHGLSYTEFEYGDVKLNKRSMRKGGKISVTVPVTNTGSVAGAETVQFYIADIESSVDRPVKELKGFAKLYLEPGETKTATVTLDESALSFYDVAAQSWIAEPGRFRVIVGASSEDIRGEAEFKLR